MPTYVVVVLDGKCSYTHHCVQLSIFYKCVVHGPFVCVCASEWVSVAAGIQPTYTVYAVVREEDSCASSTFIFESKWIMCVVRVVIPAISIENP